MSIFPEVRGEDLLGNTVLLPSQLRGEFNLIVVAFQRWHQQLVNTWVPFFKQLVAKYADLDYYELPTIRKLNFLSRGLINRGMRAGIPETEMRRRTITLYLNKDPFKAALEIFDEQNIYIFLIKTTGEVLWRETGAFTEGKAQTLLETIERTRESREP